MRYLILLLLSTQLNAQTMRLTYLGSGVIQIDNLMSCTASTRVQYIGNNHSTDTMVNVPGNKTEYMKLVNPVSIRIKADGQCSTHGWIEAIMSQTLNIQDTRVRPPHSERKFFDLFISEGKLIMTGTYRDVVQWSAYSIDGRLLAKGVSKVGTVQLPRNTALVNVQSYLFNYQIKSI
jgi:hypothetical protein